MEKSDNGSRKWKDIRLTLNHSQFLILEVQYYVSFIGIICSIKFHKNS